MTSINPRRSCLLFDFLFSRGIDKSKEMISLSQEQWMMVVAVLLFVFWIKCKCVGESFVAVPTSKQQTLSGSNTPASITVDGMNPMPLQTIEAATPLPYFQPGFSDQWANIEVLPEDQSGAVATGQPMPIQTVDAARMPIYKVNLPPIVAPMTIPATSASTTSTTQALDLAGPNAPRVPANANVAYNQIVAVDYPGNDIMCSLYDKGVSDPETCRLQCHGDAKCVGFVDVKPGANPVLPGGFCCSKRSMTDPLATAGVDSYVKQLMRPM